MYSIEVSVLLYTHSHKQHTPLQYSQLCHCQECVASPYWLFSTVLFQHCQYTYSQYSHIAYCQLIITVYVCIYIIQSTPPSPTAYSLPVIIVQQSHFSGADPCPPTGARTLPCKEWWDSRFHADCRNCLNIFITARSLLHVCGLHAWVSLVSRVAHSTYTLCDGLHS